MKHPHHCSCYCVSWYSGLVQLDCFLWIIFSQFFPQSCFCFTLANLNNNFNILLSGEKLENSGPQDSSSPSQVTNIKTKKLFVTGILWLPCLLTIVVIYLLELLFFLLRSAEMWYIYSYRCLCS